MIPHYSDPLVTLYLGDCLEVMPQLEADSIDSIVTDPPYGLGFMGKHWDHGVPGVDFWREMFRVLKPGGYLLSFAGTRTVHRFGVAIEDAGFEIRDTLMWIYASGFPKSLDVSKALDKVAGAEREVVGSKPGPGTGAGLLEQRASSFLPGDVDITSPATDLARKWEGWGTALKPAHEPIVMARKPLVGTVAQNVTRYGTGALNIDGTRIPGTPQTTHKGGNRQGTHAAPMDWGEQTGHETPGAAARWPSNVLLSDPELFDEPNPGVVGSGATTGVGELQVGGKPRSNIGFKLSESSADRSEAVMNYGDSGGYSRFFKVPEGECHCDHERPDGEHRPGPGCRMCSDCRAYPTAYIIPKASRAERERGLAGVKQYAGVAIRDHAVGEYDDFVYDPPENIGRWLREHREAAGMSAKALTAAVGAHGAVNHGGAVSNWEQELNRPTPDQWRKLREALGFDDRYDEVMTTTRKVDRKHLDGAEPAKRANVHPTVKPINLMRHLVRLVTPPGGILLDPFLGSGTTAIAASEEGFQCIGIEREAEYVEIAKGRITATNPGLGLR